MVERWDKKQMYAESANESGNYVRKEARQAGKCEPLLLL